MSCDWETIHKVGKHDFDIFMVWHSGETEEYSAKNNCPKSSILHWVMAFQRLKLQKASFEKSVESLTQQ